MLYTHDLCIFIGSISLSVHDLYIAGRIRNIYFPFDIETDTALSVATEMVAELDITDQDVTRIADMIDGEIASLVPEWTPGPGFEETPRFANQSLCHNCASNHTSSGSLMEFLSHNSGTKNLQFLQCCRPGCASMHGRFEEITFESEDYGNHVREDAPNIPSQLDSLQYQELWNQHESRELSPVESERSHSDEQYEQLDKSVLAEDEEHSVWKNRIASSVGNSQRNLSGTHYFSPIGSSYCDQAEECEKEIQQEMRWLRAKYQMELRELRDRQLELTEKSSHDREHKSGYGTQLKPFSNLHSHVNKCCPNLETQRARNCEAMDSLGEGVVTTKSSSYTGSLLPNPLHRTVSLPIDAVDI